jgi:hypothetical protein
VDDVVLDTSGGAVVEALRYKPEGRGIDSGAVRIISDHI